MIPALLLAGLGALAPPVPAPPVDTTFVIPSGARVVIEHRSGDIDVVGVGGREARVLIDGESRGIDVRRDGGVVRISAAPLWGDGGDLVVTVPRDVRLAIQGFEGDVRVEDVRGEVSIETLDGDVEVAGAGTVSVRSADGYVRLVDIRGFVDVQTGDGDTWIESVLGAVAVEGIDGDIVVLDADSPAVTIATIDGDVRYEGAVYGEGHYALATHDGDVVFALPERDGANLLVSTFDGSLLPSFPVRFLSGGTRTSSFTVGDGSARIELETFSGDIYLIRPGERFPGRN